MREKRQYTESFRQQALEKVYTRGHRSVEAVAEDLEMSKGTLRNWMRAHKKPALSKDAQAQRRPNDWTLTERLQLLLDSHGLDEESLNAFCRERGIFRHHLRQWQESFENGSASESVTDRSQLRELKEANKTLQRELNRKEKALAEAAALLVLQKKYQALWEEKDV